MSRHLVYVRMQLADSNTRESFLKWSNKQVPRLIDTMGDWLLEYHLDHIARPALPTVLKQPFTPVPPKTQKRPRHTRFPPVTPASS